MALISCGECGEEISDRAPACPHCGVPLHVGGVPLRNAPSTVEKNPAAYGVMGAVFLILFMWLLMGLIFGLTIALWSTIPAALYGWVVGVKSANEHNARVVADRSSGRTN
jgi:hypothetical protein